MTDEQEFSSRNVTGDDTEVGSDAVVVGHDGSAGADQALRYALELARDLQAPVAVVRAWSIAAAPRPDNWRFGYVSSLEEMGSATLADLVARVQTQTAEYPEVQTSCRAVHAGAAESLLHCARTARLLVVGSRGLGGVAGMLLGSVSEQCLRSSGCPVLIVRSEPGGR